MDNITHRQYWNQIRSIRKEALAEYKRHGAQEDPNEWLSTWLNQTIDGHEWIIYTQKNLFVLLWTDSQDAYFEELGEITASDMSALTAPLAYYAMMQDVMDNLDIEPFEKVHEKAS